MNWNCFIVAATVAALFPSPSSQAGEFSKTLGFELGKWYEIEVVDGPVTLHRLSIDRHTAGVTKSKLFRPGRNSQYTDTLQIRLEYSNHATRDWDTFIEIEWLDDQGAVIDGYRSKENLDEGESHEMVTASLSTLRYGISRASKLRVKLGFQPE